MKESIVKELATKLGADYSKEYCSYDRTYDIGIAAPDGQQWRAGQCIHLTAIYYSYIKGDKAQALDDIYNRMIEGLEPIDTNINP